MTIATPERQLTVVEFRVFGLPGPQGSKRSVGRGIMIESSPKVKPWRQAIQATADDNYSGEPIAGPVRVEIDFFFARPKSHYRTGKYSNILKSDAPLYTVSTLDGDLDKLLRSTLDGLSYKTGGCIIRDDCLVVCITSSKQYANVITPPGAAIKVVELP